jgi:hypothetical protein
VVGYFDLYVVFMVLWVWALLLQRRPGSSPWTGRWQWVIGVGFTACLVGGIVGPVQMLTAPPTAPGSPPPDPTIALRIAMLAAPMAHGVLAAGFLWLIGLTVQTLYFPVPKAPPAEEETA